MGKRYDAEKVNAFIDKLDEAVMAYLRNLFHYCSDSSAH